MLNAVALQHHHTIVDGLHPMTVAMGRQPAASVAQLFLVASESNSVLRELLEIHGDPVHLLGRSGSIQIARGEWETHEDGASGE